jgi:hypothetical protein
VLVIDETKSDPKRIQNAENLIGVMAAARGPERTNGSTVRR